MTRRISLSVGVETFDLWTSIEITRDLAEISGSFVLEYHDIARTRRALPKGPSAQGIEALDAGQSAKIAIDGETVLVGAIDEVKIAYSDREIRASVAGRDRTGDLVDCAASVDGPVEWRGLTLTQIAARICEPFGIAVRAETDVGPPFPVFGVEVAETAMEAIQKGCRQRAVLAVSDGVGGLVLTRGGAARGPAALRFPGNILEGVIGRSWRDRFSEYVVKGQTRPARAAPPALNGQAAPIQPDAPPVARPRQLDEAAAVIITGRARDPEILRHRPRVVLAKTLSGGASVQVQAEWMLRVARGEAETMSLTVQDWRAGDDRRLWRPNELAMVDDPLAGIRGDMIVAGLSYRHSNEEGSTTRLRLIGPEALDLIPEGEDDRRDARRRRAPAAGDATPAPLQREARPR